MSVGNGCSRLEFFSQYGVFGRGAQKGRRGARATCIANFAVFCVHVISQSLVTSAATLFYAFNGRAGGRSSFWLMPALAGPVKGYSPTAFVAGKIDMLIPNSLKVFPVSSPLYALPGNSQAHSC